MDSFDRHWARGIEADQTRIAELLQRSLMLVTALAPHIGHDAAAGVARLADRNGSTLREAALALGVVTADEFDRWVEPRQMTLASNVPPVRAQVNRSLRDPTASHPPVAAPMPAESDRS
jgi:fumarate hydratase class II